MRKLFHLAPVVAIVVLGIVVINIIENEHIMIPIMGMVLGGYLIAKTMDYLKLKATVSGDKDVPQGEMRDRLAEIERRLTDVQDVMIALSEKFDRMESDEKPEKMV